MLTKLDIHNSKKDNKKAERKEGPGTKGSRNQEGTRKHNSCQQYKNKLGGIHIPFPESCNSVYRSNLVLCLFYFQKSVNKVNLLGLKKVI